MTATLSTIERLERAADSGNGVRFVGHSVAPDGPLFVPWRQVHDEARAVGAALQAKGRAARRSRRRAGPDEP